jgi:hypothetical protein
VRGFRKLGTGLSARDTEVGAPRGRLVGRGAVADIVFILITLAFFVLSVAYARVAPRL